MHIETGVDRTKLELKYCECCGGLWLRRVESGEGRCGACVQVWRDLPGAWIRGLKRRSPEIVSRRLRLLPAVTTPLRKQEEPA